MFGTYPNLGLKDYSDEYFDVLSKKKFTDEIKNILKIQSQHNWVLLWLFSLSYKNFKRTN